MEGIKPVDVQEDSFEYGGFLKGKDFLQFRTITFPSTGEIKFVPVALASPCSKHSIWNSMEKPTLQL